MTNSIEIRNAIADEADLLSALALRSKAHWGYSESMVRSFEAELKIQPSRICSDDFDYVVAENSSMVVGFYALECGKTFELEALLVEPKYIGTGLGRRLIQHAIENAKAKGGETLVWPLDA